MTRSTPRMAALLLLLGSTLAVAQTSGTGSTGAGTSGGTKGGTTTTTPTSTTRGSTNLPPVQDQQRPINLTGRVVMEDGTAPSEKVSIERVCNGRARREAYTDSKGYFSFMIDNSRPQMMMQDASVGSDSLDPFSRAASARSPGGLSMSDPSGTRTLEGCELRAAMAGAVSESIQLSGRRAFDDPNVGTIVLRRTSRVPGATVSLTSMQAPGSAKKAFEHAKKLLAKGDESGARNDFAKATELYPNYAEAWAELADLYLKAHETDNARAACEHAVAADPRYVRPYFMMIVLAASHDDWKQAQESSDKLLALDAYSYPAAFYYNGLANYKLHNLDKADASVRAARKLDVNNKLPKIGLLMATIMMERNDFAGAVQELRTFLERVPANGSDAEYARGQLTLAQTKLASAGAGASAGSAASAGAPK